VLCYLIAMKVTVDGTLYEFDKAMAVSRLLQELSLSKEAHLVIVNNKLVTEDYRLAPNDEVRVIRVISGG